MTDILVTPQAIPQTAASADVAPVDRNVAAFDAFPAATTHRNGADLYLRSGGHAISGGVDGSLHLQPGKTGVDALTMHPSGDIEIGRSLTVGSGAFITVGNTIAPPYAQSGAIRIGTVGPTGIDQKIMVGNLIGFGDIDIIRINEFGTFEVGADNIGASEYFGTQVQMNCNDQAFLTMNLNIGGTLPYVQIDACGQLILTRAGNAPFDINDDLGYGGLTKITFTLGGVGNSTTQTVCWAIALNANGGNVSGVNLTTQQGRIGAVNTQGDASYTLLATDHMVEFDGLTANRVATLPATIVKGQIYVVCVGARNGHTMTVNGGGHNIGGAATYALPADHSTVMVQGGASNWRILSSS